MTKKFIVLFLVLMMAFSFNITGAFVLALEQNAPGLNDASGEVYGYVNFYEELEGKNISFIDGISLGITEKSDPLYFEKVSLDGLDGRKQYSSNSAYINMNDSFYDKGDTEFLVNIVYYDFGPSEGSYYFEYPQVSGALNQVRIIKPGINPGWKCISFVLADCDPSFKYANGASFRIQNGAYNAWRKIEIVNVSRSKREKVIPAGFTALESIKERDLDKTMIITEKDKIFTQENAINQCNMYDAKVMANRLALKAGAVPESYKQVMITQKELLKIFMEAMEVDYSKATNYIDFALEIGFIKQDSYFLFDEAPATYFNLVNVMDDVLYFKPDGEKMYIITMYNYGFFGNLPVSTIENEALLAEYYKEPRKNPYVKIVDNGTGRTYKYINFYGTQLNRPYLTAPQWLHDGKQFICTTPSCYIYLYNTETQMMKFLVQGTSNTDGIVGEDGMIYHHGTDGNLQTFNRIDPNDPKLESKVIYRFPVGVVSSIESIAADGTYFGGFITDKNNVFNTPEGQYPIVVFHIPEESKPGVPDTTYTVRHYGFEEPYKGHLNHQQPNPTDPNLCFFAHETNTANTGYGNMLDRTNVINMETGEVFTYNQGNARGSGLELSTHESWSADGQYLYLVSWQGSGGDMGDTQQMPAIVRINKDSSHRQYFYTTTFESSYNHCFPSADNNWVAADAPFIVLVNTNTHQLFPIAQNQRIIGSKNHPYHAHAQIARGHNIISWGHEHLGVLGIAWYDFNELLDEVAEGGRYQVNEYVECVSYKNLECESEQVFHYGRNGQMSRAGKSIYYAINTEIADTTNDAIKITFDYLDNSKNPIVITYTKGVEYQNDARFRFNGKKEISRRGQGGWKTAEIILDSANCESIGKFETDFALSGGSANLYITNLKVEKMSK